MRRQCANAASISRWFASGVRKPECADSVTFGSVVSTWPGGSGSISNTSSAGVAELARAQRLDHRRLVDQRAARGVHEQGAAAHRRDPRRARGSRASRRSAADAARPRRSRRAAARSTRTRRPGCGLRRAVPGQHLHADAERHARGLGGDAAEADQAERLAAELRRPRCAATGRRACRGPSRRSRARRRTAGRSRTRRRRCRRSP